MKIIKLCLLAFLPILLSCTQSEELETKPSLIESWTHSDAYQSRETDELPENLGNPYDLAGSIHTELSTNYFGTVSRDSSLVSVISDLVGLANTNVNFRNLSPVPYSFTNMQRLERLLVVSDSTLVTSLRIAVSDANLQISFKDFINQIMTEFANDARYSSLYDEIVSYEDSIMENVSILPDDRKVVLTATSILRHKIKKLKKLPKKNTDPDWDLMITTMGAAAEGGKVHLQEAIVLSLLVEINKSY